MELAGRVNQYRCRKCGHLTTTINAVDGTTPFGIRCKSLAGCDGDAFSVFYRCSQELRPDYEWYRPDAAELATLDAETQQYVANGCLMLRRLDAAGRERYGYRTRFA